MRGSRAALDHGFVALLAAPDDALPEPAEIAGTVEVRFGLPAVENAAFAAVLALLVVLFAPAALAPGLAVADADGTGVLTIWAGAGVPGATTGAGVTEAFAVVPIALVTVPPLPIVLLSVAAEGVGVLAAGLAYVIVAPVNPEAVLDVPAVAPPAVEPVLPTTDAVLEPDPRAPPLADAMFELERTVLATLPMAPTVPIELADALVDNDVVAPPSASA
jgi:hypothetical protein